MKTQLTILAVLVAGSAAWTQQVIPRSGARGGPQQDDKRVQEPPLGPVEKPEAPKLPPPPESFLVERPTLTYSPSILEQGTLAIEGGGTFAGANYKDIDTDVLVGLGMVRYGVSSSIEGFLEGEFFKSVQGDDPQSKGEETDEAGLGDMRFGLKWAMMKEGALFPALASIAIWKIPTGSESKGLGTGEGDLTLLTSVGHHLGDSLRVNLNFGASFVSLPKEDQRFFLQYVGSAEANYRLNDFVLMGEVSWTSEMQGERGVQTQAMGGVGFFLTDSIRIDVGMTFGISDDADDYRLMFGVSTVAGRLF